MNQKIIIKQKKLNAIKNLSLFFTLIDMKFEYQLNYNKNLLQEFSILKCEYYLDKDNNLIKRTNPEFIILLKNETDSKIQNFIQDLIKSRLELYLNNKKEFKIIN